MRHVFFIFCFGTLIYSFTQCEDSEPEIFGIEPTIDVRFFNLDSVQQIQIRIDDIENMISVVDDSLDVLDSLEDNGLGNFDEEQDALNAEKDSLSDVQGDLTSQRRNVESGLIKLDSLLGEGAVQPRIFTDTFDTYRFALNTHEDMSRFFIFFNRQVDTLTLFYARNTLFSRSSSIYLLML